MKALPKPSFEPVSIGIVGLNFGEHILERLSQSPANTWCRLAAVCDPDEAKARRIADRLGVPRPVDLDALLADPSEAE